MRTPTGSGTHARPWSARGTDGCTTRSERSSGTSRSESRRLSHLVLDLLDDPLVLHHDERLDRRKEAFELGLARFHRQTDAHLQTDGAASVRQFDRALEPDAVPAE